jgi:hypothetical protein
LCVGAGVFMEYEISVEGQLVEGVLRRLDELSERFSLTDTVDRVSRIGTFDQMNVGEERESIKREFVKALLVSNETQRLYFVVRSMMMSVLGAIITLAIFWRLGTINVIEDFVLGISTYAICLVSSRLFDKRIVNISKKIILRLGEHSKLKDFIVKNF